MNKRQITQGLAEIGAAWAVRDDKYIAPEDRNPDGRPARPAYHVHPDRAYPHSNSIIRFERLADIAAYIKARQEASELDDGTEGGRLAAMQRMELYWSEER